jgi:hypothetical protein
VLSDWPDSREAALMVAEDELRSASARDPRVPEVEKVEGDEPVWLVAWSRLLRARKADLAGQREDALLLYKQVYSNAQRRPDLRAAAEAGLRAPFRRSDPLPGRVAPGQSRP